MDNSVFARRRRAGRRARFIAQFLEELLGAAIQLKFVPEGGSPKEANHYLSRAQPNDLTLIGASRSIRIAFEFEGNAPAVPS